MIFFKIAFFAQEVIGSRIPVPRVTYRGAGRQTYCNLHPPPPHPSLFQRGSWRFIRVGGLWLCFNERMTVEGR